MTDLHARLSVVILTYNRVQELIRTLEHLLALPEKPSIVVVNNASSDSTPTTVAERFPGVKLISLNRNMGAAARNIGVTQVRTPYVAFSDDDSWWAPGALGQAVQMLDSHPKVAALCGRILLGQEEREDPVCQVLASSPLSIDGLPGPALLGFIACAVVFRRDAFLATGGYDEHFFVGGEEELLTLDLTAAGWHVVYAPQLVAHHYPSPQRDHAGRQKIVVRNALWVAWLRLPLMAAVRQTWRVLRAAPNFRILSAGLLNALREWRWIFRARKVLPARVQSFYRLVHP